MPTRPRRHIPYGVKLKRLPVSGVNADIICVTTGAIITSNLANPRAENHQHTEAEDQMCYLSVAELSEVVVLSATEICPFCWKP